MVYNGNSDEYKVRTDYNGLRMETQKNKQKID